MFDHSIKVPRLYKTASKIAKKVSDGKGSIKQLVYEGKHPNIKALYALVVHTFQRSNELEALLRKSKLLTKEPRFDPWLAKILMTELLWGKKHLASECKPVKTILAYEQIFKAHLSDVSQDPPDIEQVEKPRYVRINTLKLTTNEAIESFREEGWILKQYHDKSNYQGFLELVASLGPEEFTIDIHVPDLLVFPPKTQFYQHSAYKNGIIILQDKASCLPVHLLNPQPGSTVLDMCAAPGMKTTHAAAVMQDKGLIYAVELAPKRFHTLNKIIEDSGATCINTINRDVLTITEKECPDVEYILVDPSCSGSGITDRVEIGQQAMDQNQFRLKKLSGFQIQILRHALIRFPKAKRVVYSTCSLFPEENEEVIRQVLETCRNFKLVPAGDLVNNAWMNFGSTDFGELGKYCLYAKPEMDFTSGFFVAVLERLKEGELNQFLNRNLVPLSKKNSKRMEKFANRNYNTTEHGYDEFEYNEDHFQNENNNYSINEGSIKTKQPTEKIFPKKRKHTDNSSDNRPIDYKVEHRVKTELLDEVMVTSNDETINEEVGMESVVPVKSKNKKSKRKKQDSDELQLEESQYGQPDNQESAILESELHNATEEVPNTKAKKKKKKERDAHTLEENIELNPDNNVREKHKKKKKHKESKEDLHEIINTEEILDDNVNKKKKKRKREESNYPVEAANSEDGEKGKRKKSPSTEEISPIKKKKRNTMKHDNFC